MKIVSALPPLAPEERGSRPIADRWLCLLTMLLAFVTMSASAQIAYEATSSGALLTNSQLSWSHTVGGLAGSNRMLVVGVSTERGTTLAHASAYTAATDKVTTGVKFGTQWMDRVPGSLATSSTTTYASTELWYLPNPTVGTSTITVTFTDSQAGGIMGGAVSLTGVKQVIPEAVVANGGTESTGSGHTANITTVTDGAWLVDIVGSASASTVYSVGTGMTARWSNTGTNSAGMTQAGATRLVTPAGLVTDTWTGTVANRRSQSIAAFAPAPTMLAAAITSPANGATVGQNFTITATASAVSPATVASVTFKDGATVLGVDSTSPYSWDVTGAALGGHTVTAVVTDSNSATATSPAVSVTVGNLPPTVSITSPANGATLGTSFTISADAADTDGTVSSVAFYDGATLLGTDTTSPYSYAWTGASSGAHALTAVATDNSSAATTSAAVNVTVVTPILIGPSGSGVLAFGTLPSSNQWTTLSVTGAAADVTSAGGIDVAMASIAASSITTALGSQAGSGTSGNAYWRSGDLKLGTQPTGNKMTLLMARLQNDSGGTIGDLAVAYTLGVALTPAEEILGHRLYWSKTGATGTWTTAGDFVRTTPGTTAVSFSIPSLAWANGDTLYIVWADDNGSTTDGDFTIDDVSFVPGSTNLPPTVALTAPTGAYSGTAPATVNFAANASDTDGTVTKVEFFQGATRVGEDTTAPYTFAWTSVPAGTYALTAKATDNLGATTTSSPAVSITVSPDPNAPTIALTAPAANATSVGTSTNLQVAVSDGTVPAEPLTITFYGRKTTPATPGPDFTLMTIPDTQFYSENTGRLGGAYITIFNAQTQWMVDNRVTRNIAFVSHMGDIVQNGDFGGVTTEWDNADGAMKLIENPLTTLRAFGIPWGGAPGNHDYGPAGGGSGTTTLYNSYFGTPRFTGRNYYGGNYGVDNNNNYQLFSASGLDFIAIHLEYQSTGTTPQAILDWANALLQAYPNRRGIVTSHNTLNTGNPGTFSAQGTGIYNALKGNKNLFLMLGGHVTGEGRRTEVFNGHTVYASLQDYQDLTNGGNGFLRIFTFSPANNNIVTETWSPTLNRAATTTDHASALGTYTLAWTSPDVSPLQGSLTDWIPLGTVIVPAAGTSASLPWTGLEKDGHYEWFATVNDGVTTVSSTSRRFSTSANLAPTVALTAPANNAVLAAPAAFTLTATASDADGIARVEFYQGQTKLGEDTTVPYELAVAGLAAGNYDYLAVAVDNTGTPTNPNPASNTTNASALAKATRSAVVNVRVTSGSPPGVSLTAPTTGTVGSTIALSATASDPGGTITKVEFFRDYTKLSEDTTAPYDFSWSGFAAGSYSLTARATDNNGNVTQSSPVVIEVTNAALLTRGAYLQSASPTQMVVRWRTTANTPGRARYGTDAGNLIDYVNSTVTAAPSPATGFDHVALITGLTPATTCYYTVGTAADLMAGGPTYTFTTPPTAGTAVNTRVWVLGDAGSSGNTASPTAEQTAVRDAFYTWTGATTPNLVLQLGDNAYNAGLDAEFQKGVFNIYPTLLRRTPFWSCLGNHETNQLTGYVNTYPYFDIYTFPIAGECGGVASGTEHYYSFNYGNIHFISLDSMTADRSPTGPMAVWLQNDLASTTATWIVCYFHHPPYTKGSHNSDTESELIQMRENFGPILEAGGVDLVLTGHSHCYERSKLLDGFYATPGTFKNAGDGRPSGNGAYIKPLTGPRDHFGAVYSVTGSAGKLSNWTNGSSALVNPAPHPVMFTSLRTLGSLVLDLSASTPNRLDVTFLSSTGTADDTFTIIKQGAADSDADGIPDAYEIANGLNRFNAADATLDNDGDGYSNLKEFIFSTASNAAASRYAFTSSYNTPVAGQATVSFPTATGRTYRVMYSANLLSWQPASGVVAGTGATMQWTDDGTTTGSLPSAAGKRFYRIEVAVVP